MPVQFKEGGNEIAAISPQPDFPSRISKFSMGLKAKILRIMLFAGGKALLLGILAQKYAKNAVFIAILTLKFQSFK